ncbi:hypothetical protein [Clostridium sp. Marseille-P2415]|nr:hypothetical protein [Clostridium sp. Marseille-P2415]
MRRKIAFMLAAIMILFMVWPSADVHAAGGVRIQFYNTGKAGTRILKPIK